jgi:hypothetical protein
MAAKTVAITLPEINLERHRLHLIGTAPLIVHALAEKQRKAMLDKQMKVAKGGRDARDPHAEYDAARYKLPDGRDGFPAVGFKASAVTACTSLADVTKVAARQAFRVEGVLMNRAGTIDGAYIRTALVPIVAHDPRMREDIARLSGPGSGTELRYRPEYEPWGAVLTLILNPQVVSIGQLASMFQAAGHGVGIGDYRPERDGDCGTFSVCSRVEFADWMRGNGLTEATADAA